MLRGAPRLRRGALLIRGPQSTLHAWVPALRRTAEEALHRVRDTRVSHARANMRASFCSTGATASFRRAAAASTLSPAVSTTAEARAYSGSPRGGGGGGWRHPL